MFALLDIFVPKRTFVVAPCRSLVVLCYTLLYSDFGSLVQGNKEGPSDFFIRAMDLRNKILSESEDASELKYSPELVQGLFSRSVQTGLKDLSVRQEFRPYIEQINRKTRT